MADHSWGDHYPIKTETYNIARMKHKIPWAALSRVFQDAVTVCRELGISYLWIDSLCIVQDSKEDWETESPKMCDYYGNAEITISAGSSQDGTVPFLTERSARWMPKSFTFTNEDGSSSTIFAKETPRYLDEQDVEPITTRGWAWQEAVMSTRIVHYTASGVLWICGNRTVAEDGGFGHSWFYCGYLKARMPNLESGHLNYVSGGNPAELNHMVQFLWLDLLRSYTSKALTKDEDRLPAVSGAAAKFHRAAGAPYMAGQWATNGFERSLCWKNDAFNTSRGWGLAPSEYVAPSWSWASLLGRVEWIMLTGYTFHPSAVMVSASCEVAGANPFGSVASGYVILRGPLIKMRLECGDADDPRSYRVFGMERWLRDKKGLPMIPDSPIACVDGRPERARVKKDDAPYSGPVKQDYAPYSGQVFCLILGESFPSYKGEPTIAFGLVLGWGPEDATFHRLGVVEMRPMRWRTRRLFRKAAVVDVRIL